jgi:predicted cupin superfamily sugar epimerase
MGDPEADDIIRALGLAPHPEGGHYRETFRDPRIVDGRSASTAIYFLLREGESSHWHRIDATEIWHWYAGAPLELRLSGDRGPIATHHLGPNIRSSEKPQIVVPARAWQSAKSLGTYTLVGCTVAPAFDFAHFELAPPNWQPR